MTRLGKAYAIAAVGHSDQVDKSGATYFDHPINVMIRVKHLGESARIVAILHDFLEDCEHEHVDLSFLTVAERYALDCLNKRKGEPYLTDYMQRVLTSPLATQVKQADLIENLRGDRMPNRALTDRDHARWEKYRRALEMCREALESRQ